jgi:hypothetical protein
VLAVLSVATTTANTAETVAHADPEAGIDSSVDAAGSALARAVAPPETDAQTDPSDPTARVLEPTAPVADKSPLAQTEATALPWSLASTVPIDGAETEDAAAQPLRARARAP